jgi:putative transposase
VRAAIVRDPADYQWSSYGVHALGQENGIVSPHPIYYALGRDGPERQSAYRKLIEAQLDRKVVGALRLALAKSQPVGEPEFLRMVEGATGVQAVARPRGRPWPRGPSGRKENN